MPLHHCISTKETSDKKQAKYFFPEVTEKKLAIKNSNKVIKALCWNDRITIKLLCDKRK